MPKKQLVAEALIDLHRRLNTFPIRSHERRTIMQETANLYGVSEQSLYRALAQRARPRALRRSDRGAPRVLPQDKMEYYCELIAALKLIHIGARTWMVSRAESLDESSLGLRFEERRSKLFCISEVTIPVI